MHIKPCETVGKVISPGNPDLPIALSIRTACSVSWFAARQLACPYPSEQSGFRCVVQNLLQLRLSNHYFSFLHSGLGTSQPDPVMRHHQGGGLALRARGRQPPLHQCTDAASVLTRKCIRGHSPTRLLDGPGLLRALPAPGVGAGWGVSHSCGYRRPTVCGPIRISRRCAQGGLCRSCRSPSARQSRHRQAMSTPCSGACCGQR